MLPVLEDELPVEADFSHEGERLPELLLRLAAEADDDVGGEGHAGDHRAHVRHQLQVGIPGRKSSNIISPGQYYPITWQIRVLWINFYPSMYPFMFLSPRKGKCMLIVVNPDTDLHGIQYP